MSSLATKRMVVFDFIGVMADCDDDLDFGGELAAAALSVGVSGADRQKILDEWEAHWNMTKSTLSAVKDLGRFYDRLPRRILDGDRGKRFVAEVQDLVGKRFYVPAQNSTRIIEALCAAGLRVCIATHVPLRTIELFLDAHQIRQHVWRIYSSASKGKKTGGLYDVLLLDASGIGISPSEILVIDDELEYLYPAAARGCTTVLLTVNPAGLPQSSSERIDYAISDLEEILQLFKAG